MELFKLFFKVGSFHTRLNYCNTGCKNSSANAVFAKDIKKSFHKDLDAKMMKELGAISGCTPFKSPFIKGTDTEKKKGWKILNDFA
jgi:hypothetical protein